MACLSRSTRWGLFADEAEEAFFGNGLPPQDGPIGEDRRVVDNPTDQADGMAVWCI
ncbi:hypothetical protein [uncultured Roseobacter sp.]|uniref:hypothetical protein n=1 Tax=uncultured Roseobacter sp. TaxID=114847 RepID=UPI00262A8A2A|nr:hypothetical protein [uncultured Roseobacter sp.]